MGITTHWIEKNSSSDHDDYDDDDDNNIKNLAEIQKTQKIEIRKKNSDTKDIIIMNIIVIIISDWMEESKWDWLSENNKMCVREKEWGRDGVAERKKTRITVMDVVATSLWMLKTYFNLNLFFFFFSFFVNAMTYHLYFTMGSSWMWKFNSKSLSIQTHISIQRHASSLIVENQYG